MMIMLCCRRRSRSSRLRSHTARHRIVPSITDVSGREVEKDLRIEVELMVELHVSSSVPGRAVFVQA